MVHPISSINWYKPYFYIVKNQEYVKLELLEKLSKLFKFQNLNKQKIIILLVFTADNIKNTQKLSLTILIGFLKEKKM